MKTEAFDSNWKSSIWSAQLRYNKNGGRGGEIRGDERKERRNGLEKLAQHEQHFGKNMFETWFTPMFKTPTTTIIIKKNRRRKNHQIKEGILFSPVFHTLYRWYWILQHKWKFIYRNPRIMDMLKKMSEGKPFFGKSYWTEWSKKQRGKCKKILINTQTLVWQNKQINKVWTSMKNCWRRFLPSWLGGEKKEEIPRK